MPIPASWISHRRSSDKERLGWIRPSGEDFVAIDLLGREVIEPTDWLSAEEALDALGIRYLAAAYELLLPDGKWLRVRIIEATPEHIRVKKDDWGAIGAPRLEYTLGFPMPPTLRPLAD